MPLSQQKFIEEIQNQKSFDFVQFIPKVFRRWRSFLIGIIVFGGLGVLLSLVMKPKYKIAAKVNIQNSSGVPTDIAATHSFVDVADPTTAQTDAINEIDLLNSTSLMTALADTLHLNVTLS